MYVPAADADLEWEQGWWKGKIERMDREKSLSDLISLFDRLFLQAI